MLSAEALDVDGHGRRLRRLLEAHGYRVASVGAEGGNLITIVAPPAVRQERVSAGRLRLNAGLQTLSYEGHGVELTATETSVMHALLLRAGSVVPQRELIAALWPELDAASCKNRLYAHVFTLRRKLAQTCSRASIQTSLRGYRLAFE
ncbi:MAG: winged helix-turn-helix domain-containing protein [Candidatus Lustribacter sp.]|jgi:DNA-binding response OmpR family regulator